MNKNDRQPPKSAPDSGHTPESSGDYYAEDFTLEAPPPSTARQSSRVINLEWGLVSVVLGETAWTRQTGRGAVVLLEVAAYPLSPEDAATAFAVLHPREARVEGILREKLGRSPGNVGGMRVALIRWVDGTESLVAYPAAETSPSPKLLQSAYRNGYAARRIDQMLAEREGMHHDQVRH